MGRPRRHHHGRRRGRGGQQPSYDEFLTVVCCPLGKLCSSRTLSTCMCARTVYPGARARNLVREATSRPASRRCCARRARSLAGTICRPWSARPSVSSPRSARRRCRPPSHRSSNAATSMRGRCGRLLGPVAGHCRQSPGPGRAAVAAGSGRGVCLGFGPLVEERERPVQLSVAGHGRFSRRRRPCCRRAPHPARPCSPPRRGCPRAHG